jgi:SecD/SecF fusion protein
VTNRRRNAAIIGLVLALLTLAVLLIVPGTPLSKETKLGLDLKGGIELVYEARETPKVTEVTPQAIDDAIETIRERTDALGVSEPEISRAGARQISIGLPDVDNPQRAIEQVGTTAQLQFYDWEPNVFGEPNVPIAGSTALYKATEQASKQKPRAEDVDIPPGGANEEELRNAGVDPGDRDAVRRFYDAKNDTSRDKYYLFGPDRLPIFSAEVDRRTVGEKAATPYTTSSSCQELLTEWEESAPPRGQRGERRSYVEGTECADQLAALGAHGPPAGSRVIKVPRGVVVVESEQGAQATDITPRAYFVLEDDSELGGADIENPEVNTDQRTQAPVVTMEFTDAGERAFARVTKRIAQRGAEQILPPGADPETAFQRFAITLDNRIVSLATINFRTNPEGIDGRTGAQIENIGTFEETQDLANNLRIGALPVELKLISQTQVSATLGQQALEQGLVASGAGMALVLLFLLLFYRVLGAIAGFALITYAAFLFALVKLIPITLTLPGVAGMILTLGVAADANIVIFERIKEEARTGRSIPAAISAGYAKALRTIIDANVVTIGVAFILFMLATAGVKGFAFTLGVGTLVSLFTAVLATSAILGAMARTRLVASRAALGAGEPRLNTRIDFTGLSKWFFSMSGLILVAGALAIAGLGINFGIDFESGSRIRTPLEQPASVDDVRRALAPLGLADAKVQRVEDEELGSNAIQIRTSQLGPEQVAEVRERLDREFGVRQADFTNESIGPTFGAQIARTALIAIIASLILISLYIGLRFEFKYAVPVLIATAHDILITAGVYAIAEREVTTSTVAALLTILGYSLYDTIIVFDRIRENVPRMPRAAFSQIVNRSMSEVVVRSLATSFSTLLPVTALMLFGGETLRDFAFALLVGIASGAYSSVFIASPVLWHWKEREPIYRRRRALLTEEHGGKIPAYAPEGPGGEEATPEASAFARRARTPARAAAASGPVARPADGGSSTRTGGNGAPAGTPATPAPSAGDGGDRVRDQATRARAIPPDDGGGDGDGAPPARADGGNGDGDKKRKGSKQQRRRKHGRR